MASSVYCILSGGAVHCIPVTAFNDAPAKLTRKPAIATDTDGGPITVPAMHIKNRNLLYTLNNPSLSDLESDTHVTDRHEDLAPNAGAGGVLIPPNDSDKSDGLPPASPPKLPPKAVHQHLEVPTFSLLRKTADITEDDAEMLPPSASLDIVSKKHQETHVQPDLQAILEQYAAHAVYLPQYAVDLQTNLDSDYTQIKMLLTKVFPSWTLEIHVKRLTGGITNMLLACTHSPLDETLLVRVYGQGTNLIIDRHREFVLHLVLNSLGLAPPIHARFCNGLVYGFLPGRSLAPQELSNPYLYPLIAQQLGNWHNQVDCAYIEDGVNKLRKYTAGLKKRTEAPKRRRKQKRIISNVWDLIEDWILIVPANKALVDIFGSNLDTLDAHGPTTEENVRDVILREFRWLKSTLSHATKLPVVVSHCDLLSGNIVIPESAEVASHIENRQPLSKLPTISENPIQFIDYEYMLPAPRAFDIANHFAEWQGFDCDRSAIPNPSVDNPVMVDWCKGYLNDENCTEKELRGLIDEIKCYYGMPGFYWGIWAMIQSELSTIDFNYAEYSELRLQEYWEWKRDFLATAQNGVAL